MKETFDKLWENIYQGEYTDQELKELAWQIYLCGRTDALTEYVRSVSKAYELR